MDAIALRSTARLLQAPSACMDTAHIATNHYACIELIMTLVLALVLPPAAYIHCRLPPDRLKGHPSVTTLHAGGFILRARKRVPGFVAHALAVSSSF